MQLVFLLNVLFLSLSSLAQEGFAEIFNPNPSGSLEISNTLDWHEPKQTDAFQEKLKRRRLRLHSPLWGSDGTSGFRLSLSGDQVPFKNGFALPSSTGRVQGSLTNYGTQGLYITGSRTSARWIYSGGVSSPSDVPFHSMNEVAVTSTVGHLTEPSATDQWFFFVNYSNNRTILNNIPFPGFAYIYRPSPNFMGFFGLPFLFLTWMDMPHYIVSTGVGPYTGFIDASYGIVGPYQIFSRVAWTQNTFFHIQREERRRRLYVDEKTAWLGIKGPLAKGLSLHMAAGYSFDRALFEGTSYSKKTSSRLRTADGWLLDIKASLRF